MRSRHCSEGLTPEPGSDAGEEGWDNVSGVGLVRDECPREAGGTKKRPRVRRGTTFPRSKQRLLLMRQEQNGGRGAALAGGASGAQS